MANKYDHLRPKPIVDSATEAKRAEQETRFAVAERSERTPKLDFHGKRYQEVDLEMDRFLDSHQDAEAVMIISGHGEGAIKKAVETYLKRRAAQPDCPFEAYRVLLSRATFVLLMKREIL